jgi:two-component system chemotaxis response regulator CheB
MRSAPIGDTGAFTSARRLRLLIVDDSAVTRAVLKASLEGEPDFEIVGCVGGADQALEVLADHRVDIVLLDLEMPGTNGFTALPVIVDQGQGARVIVVSAACTVGSQATNRALMLGATDTCAKPAATEMGAGFATGLRERVRRIGYAAATVEERAGQAPIACLAIGASTGGVNALVDLLRELPASFDPPILVTQHLPPSFMPAFAGQLAEAGSRRGVVAGNGMRLEPGYIYLAPGDAHIRVARDGRDVCLRLDRRPVVSRCMPSVDPMLSSLGEVYGATAVGVVLSGMGRDGLSGAAALVAAGGTVMVQDRDSSVVWGMPGAVAEADLASGILCPKAIARELWARGVVR